MMSNCDVQMLNSMRKYILHIASTSLFLVLMCLPNVAAQPTGPKISLTSVHGVPTFCMNGSPFLSPSFETYIPEERYFRQFAEVGTRLFTFNSNVTACDYGHSWPTWLEVDVWDYTKFDERMQRVLAARPDAMVMPRVNFGTPRWWLDAHPEALEQLEGGGTRFDPAGLGSTLPNDRAYPSLASPLWRETQADALRRFIQHIEDAGFGPHIFGYMLVGMHTEEWYHWSAGTEECAGYSPDTVAAYRAWLKAKYKNESALRRAWNNPDARFANIEPPTCAQRKDSATPGFRDPATAMPLIDYLTFWNELIPETIGYFARVAKEASGGDKAIGAFYGYQYEFNGDPEFGHNALGRFLKEDSLDYLLVTASYFDREAAVGADYQRSPAYSVQLHDKVWYHDNDTISFLAPKIHKLDLPGRENDPYWGQLRLLGYTDTPQASRWMFRRTLGFSLCSGMYASFFDLHGGYFDHPELMQEIGALTRLAEDMASEDRGSVAEILVVADEVSCTYLTHRHPVLGLSLQGPQVALAQLGAPVDQVLLEDLDRIDADRYKLIIFLNAYNVNDRDRRRIERKLKRDGKWLLWCYAPGYFNDNQMSADGMRDLTGITLEAGESISNPLRTRFINDATALASRIHAAVPDPCGPETGPLPAIHVNDPEAQPLGQHPESQAVNVALRSFPNWTSVYAISPDLPPAFYRELARQAGVHLYSEKDDTLYVNQSLITLHARDDGERTLRFPEAVTLHDALTNKSLNTSTSAYTLNMQRGETRLIRMHKSQD